MLDGKSGMPRTVIDIERAAQLCVKEGPLRFAPYENRPDRSLAAETDEAEGGEGRGGPNRRWRGKRTGIFRVTPL